MSDAPLVLCADDDADIRALLTIRLERAGFRVAQAADGEQALSLARELSPVVLVLDVMMPRLSGTEVLLALRGDEATAAMRPKYGSWPIFEHCQPFNIARAYDEALGIDTPRIWTAERDRAMWAALQG